MTDGTSQGLFIVVAIVIFGIFAVLAYILFEDTLSPAMASMFINATEQASDNLNEKYLLHRDRNFTDYSSARYASREGSTAVLDNGMVYNGKNTVKVTYTESYSGGRYDLGQDFLVWIPKKKAENIMKDDVVDVSFSVKSDRDTNIHVRLGAVTYSDSKVEQIGSEWKDITFQIPVTKYDPGHQLGRGAVIFGVGDPSTVWLANLEVRLIK